MFGKKTELNTKKSYGDKQSNDQMLLYRCTESINAFHQRNSILDSTQLKMSVYSGFRYDWPSVSVFKHVLFNYWKKKV